MKKTIVALMALAGVAFAESDFTSSITSGNSGNGNYYGATLKLTDSFVSTTFVDDSINALPEILTLNSITLYSRTEGTQESSTSYLALYEYSSDSSLGTLVGISTNQVSVSANNKELTFNFSDVNISSKKQYQLLFVNTASKDDIDTLDEYQAHNVLVGMNVLAQTSDLPSGDGTYKLKKDANGAGLPNDFSSIEGKYIPKITIKTSNVPEPTTATLSLLALAGLAARRRRK